MAIKSGNDFEIIINSSILKLGIGSGIIPAYNKKVLSLINGFEDGKWRQDIFDNFIWDNISQAALSHKEREALKGKEHSTLIAAAKNLRLIKAKNSIGEGSELAEIVLYGVMNKYYKALPVVPKIFYKQNSQDNVKGADSVHIIINRDDDTFTLWFGEAKFFNSIKDSRLGDIVNSISEILDTNRLKKENSIILNVPELESFKKINKIVLDKIKKSLANRNSIDAIKSIINIPILLLHECPITAKNKEKTKEYIEEVKKYHLERSRSYFKKQVAGLKNINMYEKIKFHLILFPVPEKKPIVSTFVENVKHYKG